jgi:hypothetical protein
MGNSLFRVFATAEEIVGVSLKWISKGMAASIPDK